MIKTVICVFLAVFGVCIYGYLVRDIVTDYIYYKKHCKLPKHLKM